MARSPRNLIALLAVLGAAATLPASATAAMITVNGTPNGKDSFDGGRGKKDDCNGGADKDRKPAKGCEKKKSIP